MSAKAGSQYQYHQPSPFHVQGQQYSQGGFGSQHYSQGLHQSYHGAGTHAGNVNSGQFITNLAANQRPSLAASHNYYQNHVSNVNSDISSNFITPQRAQNGNLNPASAAPVAPIVTKHIYFHTAPPDDEKKPTAAASLKPKKTYKLIFIKVPSQESRYPYFTNAQGFTTNPYVPVEDRTLIYVLVKNPEDQYRDRVKPPNHEVYYVNYKGSANGAATQINNQLSEVASVQTLLPGLVNGRS